MRIFVTGATGFIGSHFINHAHAAGHEIIALRRRPESTSRIQLIKEPEWITLPTREVAQGHLSGCDALVQLAASGVSPQISSWDEMVEVNTAAPLHLVQLAAQQGVTRWVVAGTFAEYGKSSESFDLIPEDAPLQPTTLYAASKAAAFSLLHAAAVSENAELAYLRIFSAYGIGQHPANLWPSLMQTAKSGEDYALSPGEQIRDFVPVEVVAKVLLLAVTRTDMHRGVPWVRNLGSGNPMTVREFCQREWNSADAQGKLIFGKLPYRPTESMRYCPLVRQDVFAEGT